MSWRRFTTLIGGLSPRSRFMLAVAYDHEHGGSADVTLTDDAAIDRFIEGL